MPNLTHDLCDYSYANTTVLITVALQKVLRSCRASPPRMISLKIILVILSSLPFHINSRISLSI